MGESQLFIFFSLSLSSEHTSGLCKSYEDKHSALQDKLREKSLRCECSGPREKGDDNKKRLFVPSYMMGPCVFFHTAPCVSVSRLNSVSWRVDCILSSSELKEVNEPTVHLKLQAQGAESGSAETTVVSVSAEKFRVLLTGLFCYGLHKLLSLFLYILFLEV